MSTAKATLKKAREAIQSKEFAQVLQLTSRVLEFPTECEASLLYTARVFRGLALFQLDRMKESEDEYRLAIEMDPKNLLAFQGLLNVLEKTKDVDAQLTTMEALRALYQQQIGGSDISVEQRSNVCQKYIDASLKLAEKYAEQRRIREATEAYKRLLPEHPEFGISDQLAALSLASSTAVTATATTTTTTTASSSPATIVIPSPLTIWKSIVSLVEPYEKKAIQKEIQARRYRLGAPPLSVVQQQVEEEVVLQSVLDEAFEQVLRYTTDPRETQATTLKLLDFLHKKLVAIQSDQEKYLVREKLLRVCREVLLERKINDAATMEFYLENMDVDGVDDYPQDLLERYVHAFPTKDLAIAFQAMRSGKDPNEVVDVLQDLVSPKKRPLNFVYLSLAALQLSLQDWNGALECARQLRQKAQRMAVSTKLEAPKLLRRVDLITTKCYAESDPKDVGMALKMYLTMLESNPGDMDATEGLARVYERQKKSAHAVEALLKVMEANPSDAKRLQPTLAWNLFQCGRMEEARTLYQEILGGHMDDAMLHLRFGQVLWASGGPLRTEKPHAFSSFLRAAKLDDSLDEAFQYLGMFYQEVEKDEVRALKCYQKSFALNVSNLEVAQRLSELYLDRKDEDSVYSVYLIATEKNLRSHWAWMNLGFAQMKRADYTGAIVSLQTALRSDIKDVACWDGLAESYQMQGRYVSALKAYGKVAELEPGSLFASFQIAVIKSILGVHEEALEQLEASLKLCTKDDQRIPILVQKTKSLLSMSRDKMEKGFYGQAADCLKGAVVVSNVVTKMAPELHAPWKLVGDGLLALSGIPEGLLSSTLDLQFVNSKREVAQKKLSDVELVVTHSDPLLEAALISYILAMDPNRPSAQQWFYIALVLWKLHQTKQSYRILHRALRLEPSNPAYWNFLGVATAKDNVNLSQHAFIKSLELDNTNADAWANMGLLYLSHNELDLAGRAFFQAQTLDPEMGLRNDAIIAEFTANGDTQNLFVHAADVSNFLMEEACYGSALNAYRTRTKGDISKLESVTFGLEKAKERNPKDPFLLNLLGLCLEQMELLERSKLAMEQALANASNLEEALQQKIRINYARLLTATGRFDEAISLHATIGDVDALNAMVSALPRFFENQVAESISTLERVFGSSDPSIQCDVSLSLSQILFSRGGDIDKEKATQFLLESYRKDSQFAPAIFSLCAFGLVEDNFNLALAALKELLQLSVEIIDQVDSEGLYEWLSALVFLMQGNLKVAKAFLCKSIHKRPEKADRWTRLLRFLLQYQTHMNYAIQSIMKSASALGAHCYAEAAMSFALNGETKEALRFAWKTCRTDPRTAESWFLVAVNLRARIADCINRKETASATKFLDQLQAIFPTWDRLLAVPGTPCSLKEWRAFLELDSKYCKGSFLETSTDTLMECVQHVDSLLPTIQREEVRVASYKLLGSILLHLGHYPQSIQSFQNCLRLAPTHLRVWLQLSEAYWKNEQGSASIASLQQAITFAPESSLTIRLSLLVLLATQSLRLNMLELATTTINSALQLDSSSKHARLLQGILNLHQGNMNKAVKLLKASMEATNQDDLVFGQQLWLDRAMEQGGKV